MLDHLIMLGILLLLAFLLLFKARYRPEGNSGLFDANASRAMRGFWALIVILVHIPVQYQNFIQDAVGSFAYIGVTFFFMTSAYGLSRSLEKNPGAIRGFWLNRLPKLLIPNWAAGILCALAFSVFFNAGSTFGEIFGINRWVRWLLGCYMAFWISHRFAPKKLVRALTCGLVLLMSLLYYVLNRLGLVGQTWCPESIGFIWGILLQSSFWRIKGFMTDKWPLKAALSCLAAMVLGVLYLKFKPVPFLGDYVLKILLGLSILGFMLVLNSKISIGNKAVYFLGDISFEIYLLHPTVFEITARLLPDIGSGPFIAISMLVTVAGAALIHRLCKLILSRIPAFPPAGK